MPSMQPVTIIFTFTAGVPGLRLARPLAVMASLQATIEEQRLAPTLDGVYRYDAKAQQAHKLPTGLWRRLYVSPQTNDISVLPSLEWLAAHLPNTHSRRPRNKGITLLAWQQAHVLRMSVMHLLTAAGPQQQQALLWEGITEMVGALEATYPQWVGDPRERARRYAKYCPLRNNAGFNGLTKSGALML